MTVPAEPSCGAHILGNTQSRLGGATDLRRLRGTREGGGRGTFRLA